jgi:putative FmdB family regulatory protein
MPHYAYRCKQCGRESLHFQNISDEPLKDCPHCGGEMCRLLSGGAGVIYKGEGFYVNDYKKKPNSTVKTAKTDPVS